MIFPTSFGGNRDRRVGRLSRCQYGSLKGQRLTACVDCSCSNARGRGRMLSGTVGINRDEDHTFARVRPGTSMRLTRSGANSHHHQICHGGTYPLRNVSRNRNHYDVVLTFVAVAVQISDFLRAAPDNEPRLVCAYIFSLICAVRRNCCRLIELWTSLWT